MEFIIRKKQNSDNAWITELLRRDWGGDFITTRGVKYSPRDLRGFIAENKQKVVGICLYNIKNEECEIVLLEAFIQYQGIGTGLLGKLRDQNRRENWKRMWLVTTNDNIDALRFYQKRGFELLKIHRNAISKSRKIKPTIPETGNYGISIRDEIELELKQEN
ncbi:MAG: GNAT family N-acetyltransferase [Rectinema sp.]